MENLEVHASIMDDVVEELGESLGINGIRPNHYKRTSKLTGNTVEAIEVIDAFELDYHLGNAIKYVLRAGKKSEETRLKDIRKAIQSLEFKVKLLENDE